MEVGDDGERFGEVGEATDDAAVAARCSMKSWPRRAMSRR
jgi:hypothetical protein